MISLRAVAGGEDLMEHRWGRRIPCSAYVRINMANGPGGGGRFRDVSSSGAFIETSLAIPMHSRVTIAITRGDHAEKETELRGIVVRRDQVGIAIEWCETSEGSICTDLGCESRCAASLAGEPQ